MFPLGSLKRWSAESISVWTPISRMSRGDTVISVHITEQKNTYKVEMTMPYMGHTLRTENQETGRFPSPRFDQRYRNVLERR